MFFNLLFLTLGLVFGSFISAFSYRVVKGISIIKGRSFCDKCRKKIRWFDNIPVLSFIMLLGKCRYCKSKISLRYPIIEISTGILFLLTFVHRDIFPYNYVFILIDLLLLITIFVIDFEHQIIPDEVVFLGIVVTTVHLIFSGQYGLIFTNITAGIISSLLLLLIHLFTRGRGMGLGDVKFAILGGLIVGKLFLIWLFIAFLTGAIVGIILILSKQKRLKDKIAFGPFLVVSIPITVIWGEKIINLIFRI